MRAVNRSRPSRVVKFTVSPNPPVPIAHGLIHDDAPLSGGHGDEVSRADVRFYAQIGQSNGNPRLNGTLGFHTHDVGGVDIRVGTIGINPIQIGCGNYVACRQIRFTVSVLGGILISQMICIGSVILAGWCGVKIR